MRVLVTGIGGFAGRHLAVALAAAGHEPYGLALAPAVVDGAVAVHDADVLDDVALGRVVADVRPDGVVHLAGVSFVPAAEADPRLAYRVNVEGTVSLLRALDEGAPGARVVVVGSADAYGAVRPEELPVSEEVPLRPLGVYGASKAAAEVAVRQWRRRSRCGIVIVRPFNHTGPGQASDFVVPAFARQIVRIGAGARPAVVRVGDLSPVRDLSDVRDVVRGYVALLERGEPGATYNLCSGRGVRIGEVLERLVRAAGVEVRVETDPARVRPVDVPRMVGSHARATARTGWRPEIPLDRTLNDVLADWHRRAAG